MTSSGAATARPRHYARLLGCQKVETAQRTDGIVIARDVDALAARHNGPAKSKTLLHNGWIQRPFSCYRYAGGAAVAKTCRPWPVPQARFDGTLRGNKR